MRFTHALCLTLACSKFMVATAAMNQKPVDASELKVVDDKDAWTVVEAGYKSKKEKADKEWAEKLKKHAIQGIHVKATYFTDLKTPKGKQFAVNDRVIVRRPDSNYGRLRNFYKTNLRGEMKKGGDSRCVGRVTEIIQGTSKAGKPILTGVKVEFENNYFEKYNRMSNFSYKFMRGELNYLQKCLNRSFRDSKTEDRYYTKEQEEARKARHGGTQRWKSPRRNTTPRRKKPKATSSTMELARKLTGQAKSTLERLNRKRSGKHYATRKPSPRSYTMPHKMRRSHRTAQTAVA